MDVDTYIHDEVTRQKSTDFGGFRAAMLAAKNSRVGFDLDSWTTFAAFVCSLAYNVDRTMNTYHSGTTLHNLRRSHVGFMDGGTAAPAVEVPERFNRWCVLTYPLLEPGVELTGGEIDFIIKQLLQIHPWLDGNGRTASILRNWMLGTLDDPTPLPYYFGQEN
jgi:hypothetical protein